MIRNNIERIFGKIKAVCERTGRNPDEIVLVGITKFADIPQIKEAIGAGLTHIGENKVQQARKKFPVLNDTDACVTKHMVGHLQTNKVKQALETFDLIESVDSLKLAAAIEEQSAKSNKKIDIFVQVNTAEEKQKFGIRPSDADALVNEVLKLKHLRLLGLMTIAPFSQDQDIVRACFRDLRVLRDRITKEHQIELKYLSMGMTEDFEVAIEEGSNMVRIGRAIFQP